MGASGKKKIQIEIETYHPELAKSAGEIDQAAHLLKRTKLQLKQIRTGENVDADLLKIDTYLLSTFQPQKFDGSDGLAVVIENNFGETCVLLSQHVQGNVKRFTVREFYNALRVVKRQLRPKR